MIGTVEGEALSAPAILVAANPDFAGSREEERKFGRFRRGAIILAALFHAAILAAFLFGEPLTFAPAPAPPPAIPVALVVEPPPAPAKPQAKPAPPAPQKFYDLHSGAAQETTAPPPAEAKGDDAAPKPEPPPPTAAEAAQPSPPKPQHATPAQPKPKEATRETAPKLAKREAGNIRFGDKEQEGDPYLNALLARIEQHRSYPANAVGPFGLRLQGTAVYLIAVAPNGSLQGIKLQRSSGSALLDETALKMIEESAPFPPLPPGPPPPGCSRSARRGSPAGR